MPIILLVLFFVVGSYIPSMSLVQERSMHLVSMLTYKVLPKPGVPMSLLYYNTKVLQTYHGIFTCDF